MGTAMSTTGSSRSDGGFRGAAHARRVAPRPRTLLPSPPLDPVVQRIPDKALVLLERAGRVEPHPDVLKFPQARRLRLGRRLVHMPFGRRASQTVRREGGVLSASHRRL